MSKKIHKVRVTKWGKCGVCKRKVNEGEKIEFLYEDERYKCRHNYYG